jgi:hypothetical protein
MKRALRAVSISDGEPAQGFCFAVQTRLGMAEAADAAKCFGNNNLHKQMGGGDQ